LSGSEPAPIAPQTPFTPAPFLAAVQARQRPAHAVLQQTPSTQEADWHSLPAPQALPLGSGEMHADPLQMKPEAQSAVVAQVSLHAPFEHA
jgi:hypothetical protein